MYRRWRKQLIESKVAKSLRALLQRIILPGFDGIPLFDAASFFFRGLIKGSVNIRAAALSYNMFLALFPAIIVFFSLIPYVPIHNFQETLMETMARILPENAFLAIESTIADIILQKKSGILSLSFVLVLFFSFNVVSSIIIAFNKTYHSIDTRSFLKQKMISAILILIISGLIIFSVLLITIGKEAIQFLVIKGILKGSYSFFLLQMGRWLAILFAVFFGFSAIYYLAPTKKTRFRFFSAGSTFATLLFIMTAFGFKLYVNSFARYNALYGSIGTLIIVMIWIYLNSTILLLGFELNASIKSAKRMSFLKSDQKSDFV